MKHFYLIIILVSALLLLASCTGAATTETPPSVLTVMTHDSFAVSEDVVKAFEEENEVSLVFLKSGDTGAALNRAILTRNNPEADVFYGVDNTFLSRALQEGLFEPYTSPALASLPEEFTRGLDGMVTPIDFADVCINYDKSWFAERGLAVPQTLADLAKPVYKGEAGNGLLVVENPATSSPGLAFLLTTISEYGEAGYLDYWRSLKQNGVVVVNDWETAYYTNFSGSSGRGSQPMVVSYASSPAAELIYAETPLEESPTGSIVADGTCWRQIEFAGILKGTPKRALAEKFIDFMLSKPFQEDMPLQMFVFPVLPDAALPEAFMRASAIPAKPAVLDPLVIAAQRDGWLRAWTDLMLK